jgi:hypothetical protein
MSAHGPRILTVVLKATRSDPQGRGPGARLSYGLLSQRTTASRAARPIVAARPAPRGPLPRTRSRNPGHSAAANPSQLPARTRPILRSARPPAPARRLSLSSLRGTLPPFPMWPALPAPEYYGGSAPPAPSAGVAPVRLRPPGREEAAERPRAVPTFTAVRSAGQAPGSAPAASPRLPRSTFTVASHPRRLRPGREFPPP